MAALGPSALKPKEDEKKLVPRWTSRSVLILFSLRRHLIAWVSSGCRALLGNTALVEDKHLDLKLLTNGLFRLFPFPSLCSLQSFLDATQTSVILGKTPRRAGAKCSLMSHFCRLANQPSSLGIVPRRFYPLLPSPAHKNPRARLDLSRALGGLNRVLLQQTCLSNHLESSPDLSSVGRPKMIPKDQSSSFMRMTKKMWETRVEQRRMFLYICVSVHVCECLL